MPSVKVSNFPNFNAALQAAAQSFGGKAGELILDKDSDLVQTAGWVFDNLAIRGEGETRVNPTFDNGDYLVFFNWGGDEIRNITLRDFLLPPSAGRANGAGYAAKFVKSVRCSIENVDLDLPEIPQRHDNGFWFDAFDDISLQNVKAIARSKCLKINGRKGQSYGADLYLGGGSKMVNFRNPDLSDWQPDSAIIHIAGSCGGIWIAEGDYIYGGTGLLVDRSETGEQNREIFLNGPWFDSCAWDGIRLAAGSYGTLSATGAWSCSNGKANTLGCGLRVDPSQIPGAEGTLTGCHMFNNREDGTALNGGDWSVSGGRYTDNRGWGIGFHNSGASGIVDGGPLVRRNGAGAVRRIDTSKVILGNYAG